MKKFCANLCNHFAKGTVDIDVLGWHASTLGNHLMTIPTFDKCMRPLLQTLSERGATQINDATSAVADMYQLSGDERSQRLPSGASTTIRSRVGWARTFLNKAGLIAPERRGVWKITDVGCAALKRFPHEITVNDLRSYKPFQEWSEYCNRNRDEEKENGTVDSPTKQFPSALDSNVTPEEQIERLELQMRKDVEHDLLKQLREIHWTRFEVVVEELVIKLGYGASEVEVRTALRSGSGDHGVDGVVKEDRLGLDLIYIQAKRWKDGNTVGRPVIQSFVGAMDGKARKGVFITTSDFSKEAKEYANSRADKRVILIDGPQLAGLMVDAGLGVSERRAYRTYRIDQEFLDQADE